VFVFVLCFSEAVHQIVVMIMAGFAGNPHMIACTVLALTRLVHDHRGIVMSFTDVSSIVNLLHIAKNSYILLVVG